MGCHEVILIDTHVAIWIATPNANLGKRSRALAEEALADGTLAICAISFWEIALLMAKGRYQNPLSPFELRAQLLDTGVIELPLTGNIAILAVGLENLHADPADRLIAATAISHNAMLMTADKALLHWRHKLPRQDAAK